MLGLCEHGDVHSDSITEDLFTKRIKQFLITKIAHSGISCTSWNPVHCRAWQYCSIITAIFLQPLTCFSFTWSVLEGCTDTDTTCCELRVMKDSSRSVLPSACISSS